MIVQLSNQPARGVNTRVDLRLLSDEGLNAASLRSLVRNVVGAKYFPRQRADLVLLQRFRVMPGRLLGAR